MLLKNFSVSFAPKCMVMVWQSR